MADTPQVTGAGSPSGAPPVTDYRPTPRGVLPRGVQTWIMIGVAVGMLAIMFIAGRADPPVRTAASVASAPAPASADRVRDYQARLRALEAQALLESQVPPAAAAVHPFAYDDPQPPAAQDQLEAERKRREYESLFASNVVISRRPDAQRPDSGRPINSTAASRTDAAGPSIDEIADAVMRASARVGGGPSMPNGMSAQSAVAVAPASPPSTRLSDSSRAPGRTDAISAAGPLHRVLEGTVIDAVLTNRLDGASAAPVNCLVTNPLYSHSGQHVLIPAGARIMGETKPVQTFGEVRLAVAFHRLIMPDGRTVRLDEFIGLQQIGDAGLRDRVNQHYLSTFGAAAAVGLVSGLSQFLGSAGLSRGSGDRTVIVAGGVGDATSQATAQVMNRFLNRLPTVTIREGHRVKVYLTSDLELPAYTAPAMPTPF